MSANVQSVLAGVNLNFQSKSEPSMQDVHSLSLVQKTGSSVSTGVLETYVFKSVICFSFIELEIDQMSKKGW